MPEEIRKCTYGGYTLQLSKVEYDGGFAFNDHEYLITIFDKEGKQWGLGTFADYADAGLAFQASKKLLRFIDGHEE